MSSAAPPGPRVLVVGSANIDLNHPEAQIEGSPRNASGGWKI